MKPYTYLNIGSLIGLALIILWLMGTPLPLIASDETPTVVLATTTDTPTYLLTITPPPSLTPTETITPTLTVTPTLTSTPTLTVTHINLPASYRLIDQREDTHMIELTVLMPSDGDIATLKTIAENETRITRINVCARIANPFQRIAYGDPIVCMMSLWYGIKDTD